jgi:hypothetical protein
MACHYCLSHGIDFRLEFRMLSSGMGNTKFGSGNFDKQKWSWESRDNILVAHIRGEWWDKQNVGRIGTYTEQMDFLSLYAFLKWNREVGSCGLYMWNYGIIVKKKSKK